MKPVFAQPDQVPRLVELLCQSFIDDPIVQWMLPGADDRLPRLTELFRLCLRLRAFSEGEVLTTEKLQGTFVWSAGARVRASFWRQMTQAGSFLRFAGPRRAGLLLSFFNTLEAQHPPEDHVYLQFMAVDPRQRGQGIARDLLRPVLELADRKRLPCYGETAIEQNVYIWQRYGLRAVGEIHFRSAPKLWKLRREPQ